jgi:hypothetical protein
LCLYQANVTYCLQIIKFYTKPKDSNSVPFISLLWCFGTTGIRPIAEEHRNVRESLSINNPQTKTRGKEINQVRNCVNGVRIVKLKHEGIIIIIIIIHNIFHGRNNITCSTNCK